MGALDGLDVQVANAIVLADCRVARVRQRAGALVAQTGHVVLVPAKKKNTRATRPARQQKSRHEDTYHYGPKYNNVSMLIFGQKVPYTYGQSCTSFKFHPECRDVHSCR